MKSWYVAFFQLPWLPEFLLRQNRADGIAKAFLNMAIDKGAFPPHVLAEYRTNALISGALTAMINYYRANLKILEETSPPIDVPTLMLWGEEDKLIGPDAARWYAKAISGSTLRIYPGIGHLPQEEAPDATLADLKAWLVTVGVSGKPG